MNKDKPVTCDECGGKMISDMWIYLTFPPQEKYICEDCGHEKFVFV